MKPDDPLLKILACPLDKGPLSLLADDEVLYNPRLRRRYPILDGIPQLLPSSGVQVADAEHERILRHLAGSGAPAPDPASAAHPLRVTGEAPATLTGGASPADSATVTTTAPAPDQPTGSDTRPTATAAEHPTADAGRPAPVPGQQPPSPGRPTPGHGRPAAQEPRS